jgi:PhnB protein
MKLHTYLNYGGNCRQAFEFYEKHLGGKIASMRTYADMPGPTPRGNAVENKDAILHAHMTLGETELMAADVPAERYKPMRSAYLSLTVGSAEEADRIYNLLAEGAEIFMPIAPTFFSPRFAMLRDRFGPSWMIIAEGPHAPEQS